MYQTIWSNYFRAQKWRWLALMSLVIGLLALAIYEVAYNSYLQEAQTRARQQAKDGRNTLASISQQHQPLLYSLAASTLVKRALTEHKVTKLNQHLRDINHLAGLEAIYLMDEDGLTIAASNFADKVTYIGSNYSFRPYFTDAIKGHAGDFFAIGATTGKPGYFISQPIHNDAGKVIGVLATKVSVDDFAALWPHGGEQGFITDEHGIIILASQTEWLYHSLSRLRADEVATIKAQKQFAKLPINPLQWQVSNLNEVKLGDKDYLYSPADTLINGWQLHLLLNTQSVRQKAILTSTLITMALVFLLAWALIIRSRRLDKALKESEHIRKTLLQVNERLENEVEERIQAQDKLHDAQRKLIQSSRMAALGQLSASVIHELGQPLSALKNYLHAAELSPHDDDMDELLGNLHAVVKRMQSTTDELRLFARPDNKDFSSVNLNQAIDKAVELSTQSLCFDNINIVRQYAQTEALTEAQPRRLEQVVCNLLSNARSALQNREQAEIIIKVSAAENAWLITVTDNGPGFGNTNPEQLFEAFYTSRKDSDGMGLGLAICAAIVEEHHGNIWAKQPSHGGAQFCISLPAINSA